MPPVKVAQQRLKALAAMGVYTLSGGLSSAVLGALLGLVGWTLLPDSFGPAAAVTIMLVAVAAALRDTGRISFPIPGSPRQTNVMWVRTLGPILAAVLWGMDLGLVVTTRVTFAGTWIVLALAAASRSPTIGALVLSLYWTPRAAQVWMAPLLLRNSADTPELLQDIYRHRSLLHRTHLIGLVWIIGVLGFVVGVGEHL